jgi:hypothetical protein
MRTKLTKWEIFNAKIPVLVTYTPYRNVYGMLQEIKHNMVTKKEFQGMLQEIKTITVCALALRRWVLFFF